MRRRTGSPQVGRQDTVLLSGDGWLSLETVHPQSLVGRQIHRDAESPGRLQNVLFIVPLSSCQKAVL